MGWYVEEGRDSPDRVKHLLEQVPNAREVTLNVAYETILRHPEHAVLVAVDNGGFTAIGYAFNREEFNRFFPITDSRSKRTVLVPIEAIPTLIPHFPKKGTREYLEVMRPRR